jgi:short-chain fatty acids transporter
MLVRAIARRHPAVDYRLLVAVAYLGMGTTWHGGPSGSVPLLLATPGNFMIRAGMVDGVFPLATTVFTPLNLALMAVVAVSFAGFAVLLYPQAGRVVTADPRALEALAAFTAPSRPSSPTPAERVVHGPVLNRLVGGLGLLYLALEARGGSLSLTLDSVNLLSLSLGILLHPSPASLLRASEEASRALHGVVLQFPLYAGIFGIMKGTGLAELLAQAFLALARPAPFVYPFVVFCYSAVLNYFVPSGGSKWAIEALYVLGAGKELGFEPPAVAMAYAYGDMATNLIQPFWAIPLLGVARLEFREILGYEALLFLAYAALVGGVLLVSS